MKLIGVIELHKIDGKTKEKIFLLRKKNTIVNNGLAQIAYLLGEATAEAFTKGAIGDDGTTPTTADTALGNQLDEQTVSFSRVTTNVTNDTAQFTSVHTAPVGGWTVREYGLKTASGLLLNRVTFSDVNLAENDQIEITYKVIVSR
jgi:hypothetical protein